MSHTSRLTSHLLPLTFYLSPLTSCVLLLVLLKAELLPPDTRLVHQATLGLSEDRDTVPVGGVGGRTRRDRNGTGLGGKGEVSLLEAVQGVVVLEEDDL